MARITEALYKNKKQSQILNISDITPGEYTDEYKGNLFCTTHLCSAQLSFVYIQNNKSHFRTWRESKHIEQCIHFFEKTNERSGNRRNGLIEGIVSREQIKRSLMEAFENENMSEAERNLKREKDKEVRARRKRDRIVKSTNEQPAQRIVTDPSRINENMNRTGTRLYKRDADALKDTDVGQTRTVTGILKSIEHTKSNAVIQVEKNNKIVTIKFEEAFFAINTQYQGLFHHIQRYMKENNNIIFSATGEVRENKKNGQYELVVFDGVGFLIHGRSIESLASEYALRDNKN